MAVPSAPVRVPSQRPLAPSVASVTSAANDKGDNEMILGAVHRSPGICLTAEENDLTRATIFWDCSPSGDVTVVSVVGSVFHCFFSGFAHFSI